MKQAFLTSQRLHYQPLCLEHLSSEYIQWLNDAEVCRFNRHHTYPYNEEKAKAYIQAVMHDTRSIVLAIIETQSNRHIGNIALQQIDPVNRSADLSILIGERSAWGRSYATEAFSTLMAHGFGALNLHRIYCGTAAENRAMRHVAQKVGMRQEGVRREAMFKEGRYLDIVEFGILREEFDQPTKEET